MSAVDLWNTHSRRPTRGRRVSAAEPEALPPAYPADMPRWPGMECCCVSRPDVMPNMITCHQVDPDCPRHPQLRPMSIAEVRRAYHELRGIGTQGAYVPLA